MAPLGEERSESRAWGDELSQLCSLVVRIKFCGGGNLQSKVEDHSVHGFASCNQQSDLSHVKKIPPILPVGQFVTSPKSLSCFEIP